MITSNPPSKTLRPVRPSGNGLRAVPDPKDKLCHPFVLATWVEATFGVAVADADPDLPVAFGVHPPNKGTKGAPKASTAAGVSNPRQRSVKCTVSCRLVDKRARAVLEDIVDNVTRASRFASHLVNLHVIRLLDAGQGVLPPNFALNDKLVKACTSLAKAGTTATGELLATMQSCEEQLAGGRFDYRQQNNASKHVRGASSRLCPVSLFSWTLTPPVVAGRHPVPQQLQGQRLAARPWSRGHAPQERVQAARLHGRRGHVQALSLIHI